MRRAFVVCVCVCVVSVGCSVALGFDHYSDNVDKVQCSHVGPPAQPTQEGAGKDLPGLTAAFSFMSLEGKDERGNPIPMGFDLDTLCTGDGDAGVSSCKPVAMGATAPTDEIGTGRDHAITNVIAQTKASLPFNDALFNQALQQGLFSELIHIENYNGTANDKEVAITFYNGVALAGTGGATFHGDSWYVERAQGGLAKYTAKGYVTNGTLAAHFTPTTSAPDGLQLVFTLPAQGVFPAVHIPLLLTDAQFTARISVGNDGLTLNNGMLGGRITSSNALEITRAFGVCSGPNFDRSRQLFCALADLPNKDGFCDVLSFALAFTATPATTVGEKDLPPTSACVSDAGAAGPAPSCTQ